MKKITENSFIKMGNRYLLKDSNSLYFSEIEKNKIIEDNSILEVLIDISSNECQGKRKIKKNVSENEPIKPDAVKETTTIKE